ncbi:UNVERIFIED_CONTAM: acyltransferase [Bacteroidetes bacterium 56_B9]
MNPILSLVKIKIILLEAYKESQFKKWSIVGENTHFGHRARCVNQTGRIDALRIGRYCDIDATIAVQNQGNITVGDYTTIRYDSVLGCVEKIRIGSYVIISNNVHIYDNNNHPTAPEIRKEMCKNGFYGDAWRWSHSVHKPVIVGDNVWIGERATILKGVTIGEGSIIGCDSVVTHDVPPYSVAAGNPAKIIKYLKENSDGEASS